MFDEKNLDSYKQITPSPYLKERIKKSFEETAPKENIFNRGVLNIKRLVKAASFVAVCGMCALVVFLLKKDDSEISVYLYGDMVSDKEIQVPSQEQGIAMAAYSKNMAEKNVAVNIPLEIDSKGEAKIKVSSGSVETLDKTRGAFIESGEELVIDEKTFVQWYVTVEDDTDFSMSIENEGEICTYILRYDEDDQIWYLSCND